MQPAAGRRREGDRPARRGRAGEVCSGEPHRVGLLERRQKYGVAGARRSGGDRNRLPRVTGHVGVRISWGEPSNGIMEVALLGEVDWGRVGLRARAASAWEPAGTLAWLAATLAAAVLAGVLVGRGNSSSRSCPWPPCSRS